MKTYNIYRVDYMSRRTELVGKVEERRREERTNNAADILRVARKIYPTSSLDSHLYILDAGVPWVH